MNKGINLVTKRNFSNILRKELLYHSRQRGWLEVDIILGSWATDNIHKLSEKQLNNYKCFLSQETSDIYKILLGNKDIPKNVDSDLVDKIKKYASEEMKINNPLNYEHIKRKMSN